MKWLLCGPPTTHPSCTAQLLQASQPGAKPARPPPTCPSASGVSSVAREAGCEAAAGGLPLPWLLLPRPLGPLGSTTLRANPNCGAGWELQTSTGLSSANGIYYCTQHRYGLKPLQLLVSTVQARNPCVHLFTHRLPRPCPQLTLSSLTTRRAALRSSKVLSMTEPEPSAPCTTPCRRAENTTRSGNVQKQGTRW